MPYYRKATLEDAFEVGVHMKEADRLEVEASSGGKALDAMLRSFYASDEANAIVNDEGEVLGIFGYVAFDGEVASPWMLTKEGLDLISIPFLRGTRKWVKEVNSKHPLLLNYVDKRNDTAIKWLRFAGFTFLRELPYGTQGEPFYEFVRIPDV